MALEVLTGPSATDLTTRSRVKEELGLDGTTEHDELFDSLIADASEAINRELDRGTDGLAEQEYRETVGAHASELLTVSRTPVKSVASITRDGQTLSDVVIEDAETGLLYRENGFGSTETFTREFGARTATPREALKKVTVEYTAGWVMPGASGRDLPRDLERAAIVAVKAWFKGRKRDPAISSEKVGRKSVDYVDRPGADPEALPPAALRYLAPYRRVA